MVERTRSASRASRRTADNYFAPPAADFVSTGCTVLDCKIGGGWALGRVSNVVGDTQVGKCARDFYFLSSEGLLYSDDVGSEFAEGATSVSWCLALDRDRQVTATHFWKEEVSLTRRVATRYGLELTATPDHKVMVMRLDGVLEMVPVGDLREGDWLAVSSGTRLFPERQRSLSFSPTVAVRSYAEVSWPTRLDATLAAWLGACWADGTVSSGPLGIMAHKPWKRRLLEEWSAVLFPGAYRVGPTGIVYSKQVRQFVEYLAGEPLRGMTARHKCVPEIVRRSPAEVQAAFLRSLMDFDGYLRPGWGLVYSTASRSLAREVQLMLLNFGVFALMERSTSPDTGLEYYDLGLAGRRFDAFSDLIGTYRQSTKKRSTKTHSDVDSIPYGCEILRQELTTIRERKGWSRNGRLANGSQLPRLGVTSRRTSFASYDYFEECVRRLGELASDEFREQAARLLNWRPLFDRVVSCEEVPGRQFVYDVHVPEGHLFWASGLVNHNTLLAIEACANFHRQYPRGRVWYREAEGAFDVRYAETVGLPVGAVDFGPDGPVTVWDTIEDVVADLDRCVSSAEKSGQPGLYVIDSLDSISSRAEQRRRAGDDTYGLEKQKMLGQMFRRMVRRLRCARVALLVVSQIRENIGVRFGERYKRVGGKSLDFYASQIVWLHHMKRLTSEIRGVERVTAVRVAAKSKKNKVGGEAFGTCEFVLRLGFGVDDLEASLRWLKEVGRLGEVGIGVKSAKEADKVIAKMLRTNAKMDDELARRQVSEVAAAVRSTWADVDASFRPARRKYG